MQAQREVGREEPDREPTAEGLEKRASRALGVMSEGCHDHINRPEENATENSDG